MKKDSRIGLRIDEESKIRWKKAADILEVDLTELILEATDIYIEKKLKNLCSSLEREIFELELTNENNLLKIKKKKKQLNKNN